jgi:uncharacterized protein (DUF305 family)
MANYCIQFHGSCIQFSGPNPADGRPAPRPEFDRRFVTMVTAHHRGAVQTAADVLNGGIDQTAAEPANEMAVEQGSEIRRMEQIRVG